MNRKEKKNFNRVIGALCVMVWLFLGALMHERMVVISKDCRTPLSIGNHILAYVIAPPVAPIVIFAWVGDTLFEEHSPELTEKHCERRRARRAARSAQSTPPTGAAG